MISDSIHFPANDVFSFWLIPLQLDKIPLHIYVPHFLYPLANQHVCWFLILALVNSVAISKKVQMSWWKIPLSGITRLHGHSGLSFVEVLLLIAIWDTPIYIPVQFVSGDKALHSQQQQQ